MIPKIQYKNVDDVNGLPLTTTRILLDSITGLEVGMNVLGANVPIGTTIVSFTLPSSINISAPFLPNIAQNFSFCYQLDFVFPPVKDEQREKYKLDQTVSISRSGVRQFLNRYDEFMRPVTFKFLTEYQIDWLSTMYVNWFARGEFIRYFDDDTLEIYDSYQARKSDFKPKHTTGTKLYSLKIDMVRTG